MNSDISIRQATAAEAPEIFALVQDAYRKWIAVIGGRPLPMTADYDALIARQQVYSAREGGALVGVIVLWPQDDALYIDNLAVAPAQQGRGIGRLLLAFAEQQARALGLTALTLLTNEKMTTNQTYYARYGYVETGRETMPSGRRAVWMRKTLA